MGFKEWLLGKPRRQVADSVVQFKSWPENWQKEVDGRKRNTIRHRDRRYNDARFDRLDEWINNPEYDMDIEVVNTDTMQVFKRRVTDVTKWNEQDYIISW